MGGGRVAQATNADKATEATHSSTTDTLKTPVEINGTSFDGSKSITTNKWGTKRTIFLKNGTSTFEASIDGSSDIELEIPQLSSSEDTPGTLAVASFSEVSQGTINNKAVTPAGLKQFMDKGQIGSYLLNTRGLDLNAYTEQGNYWINGTGQTNGPRPTETGGVAGVLNVYRNANSEDAWIMQIFTEAGSTINGERVAECWHRISTTKGASWSIWCSGDPATETKAGVVKLATAEEVKAGTNTAKVVTPKTLKDNYLPIDYGKDIDLKAALDTAMS